MRRARRRRSASGPWTLDKKFWCCSVFRAIMVRIMAASRQQSTGPVSPLSCRTTKPNLAHKERKLGSGTKLARRTNLVISLRQTFTAQDFSATQCIQGSHMQRRPLSGVRLPQRPRVPKHFPASAPKMPNSCNSILYSYRGTA
jgi:hypothetical protein